MHLCRKTGCNRRPGVPCPPPQVLPALALPGCGHALPVRGACGTAAVPRLRGAVLPCTPQALRALRGRAGAGLAWAPPSLAADEPLAVTAAAVPFAVAVRDVGGCHGCPCRRGRVRLHSSCGARWEPCPSPRCAPALPQPRSCRRQWVVTRPGRSWSLRCSEHRGTSEKAEGDVPDCNTESRIAGGL